jgi:hypothetical protein
MPRDFIEGSSKDDEVHHQIEDDEDDGDVDRFAKAAEKDRAQEKEKGERDDRRVIEPLRRSGWTQVAPPRPPRRA